MWQRTWTTFCCVFHILNINSHLTRVTFYVLRNYITNNIHKALWLNWNVWNLNQIIFTFSYFWKVPENPSKKILYATTSIVEFSIFLVEKKYDFLHTFFLPYNKNKRFFSDTYRKSCRTEYLRNCVWPKWELHFIRVTKNKHDEKTKYIENSWIYVNLCLFGKMMWF